MNKAILLVLLLVSLVVSVFALEDHHMIEEKILAIQANNPPDSVLVNLWEEAYNSYKVSDPLKAINYLKKIASYKEEQGDIDEMYHRYIRIGQLYQQMGMANFALEYLFKASGYFLTIDDDYSLAWLHSDIGNVYYAMGQYDIAQPYYEDGLEYMIELDDKYGQSVMHNNIALCKASNKQHEEAFKHLEIGLRLRQEINHTYAVYHSKLLISRNYLNIQEFTKAERYLKDIWDNYQIDEEFSDEAKILRASAGLGLFQVNGEKGQNELALDYLNNSIALIEEVGDYLSLSSALNQKAHYYISHGKPQEAKEIFTEIFEYSYKHGIIENAHYYSQMLVRLNYWENNLLDAKKYFNTYVALTDSIIMNRTSQNLVKLHSVVQNHVKEVENNHLKAKSLYNSRLLTLSTVSMLIIIILIILIYIKDKKTLDKIRKLANASSEGIVVHDRGSIIDTNNQFKRMFFSKDSKQRVSNILDLTPKESKDDIQELLFADEKVVLESHLINANNELIDVKISSRPYIYKRKEVRVAVIQDTTKLNEIIKTIKDAEAELRVLNATKDRLFSIIAHDLKNPFNAIIGFTNLMKDSWKEMDPSEIDEMIAMINESSISAHTLLENLLDWARIQTKQLSFNPTKIRVYESIQETISLLSAQIKLKKIKIFVDCSTNIYASADSRMFSTIMRNILSNSIKFSNMNGEISIKVKSDDSSLKIILEDDGVGMTQEQIDNIFDKNSITSQIGTQNEKGTGLGLILCKELIDYHKGQLEVESQLNIGTKINITLPLV